MKWNDTGLKTAAARVEGLGSAKSGTDHWIMQRLTAMMNLPLIIWLIWSVITHDFTDYAVFVGWLAEPVNSILMILVILSTFYHAVLGTQVIVEDYVHNEAFKIFKLVGQRLFFFALAVACLFSVLKIAFTV
jgi:succinate dehydrogenase / fumarate reductase membrane anchor subunit